jgi:uncharacterized delta-60 repeat protein
MVSANRINHRSRRTCATSLRVEVLEDRRLLAAGALDPSFDVDGIATYSVTGPDERVAAVVLQPVTGGSEKILVGGHVRGAGGSFDFYLARYNSDGSPDLTFGTNGKAVTDFSGGVDSVNHLLITSQGKILAIGQAYSSGGLIDVGIAQYTANGVLDKTYGTKGKVTAQFMGGFAEIRDSAYAAVLDVGDRLVIAGQSSGRNFDGFHRSNYVARFTAGGGLDKTFGKSGKVVSPALLNSDDNWGAVTVSFGEIIVVGTDNRLPTVARFGEKGGLLGKSTLLEAPGDVVFQSDGETVVRQFVGARTISGVDTGNDIQLVRFNVLDGTIDTGFGTAGRTVTDFGSGSGVISQDTAHDVTIDAQGRILVAGYMRKDDGVTYVGEDFLLVRYDSSGDLDMSFGAGGAVVTPVLGSEVANRVLEQADGRILLFGSSTNLLVLARYLGEEAAVAPAATESSAEASSYDAALAALLVEEDVLFGRRRK